MVLIYFYVFCNEIILYIVVYNIVCSSFFVNDTFLRMGRYVTKCVDRSLSTVVLSCKGGMVGYSMVCFQCTYICMDV